jgi:hypothetical protein
MIIAGVGVLLNAVSVFLLDGYDDRTGRVVAIVGVGFMAAGLGIDLMQRFRNRPR